MTSGCIGGPNLNLLGLYAVTDGVFAKYEPTILSVILISECHEAYKFLLRYIGGGEKNEAL